MQLRELREYVANHRWQVAQEFADTISGYKSKRPQLDTLMGLARLRKVDVIVTWRLDRWGRSLSHLSSSIAELSSHGVRFLVPGQGIDTDQSNPMSKLMIHMLSAFAEFERDMIRERTIAGVRRYKQDFEAGKAKSLTGKNLPIGRPRRVFRRDEAWRMRAEGMSLRAIAKALGVPHSTVADACTETTMKNGVAARVARESPRA